MKPKFNIGDLVEHIGTNALGLVVGLDKVGNPIVEIVKSGSGPSPYIKEGAKGTFYAYAWKHTEE